MLFREVINQRQVKATLLQALNRDRLGHALLFQAPEGAGGLPLALAFAQFLVCTSRNEEDACGECPACKKAAGFQHPDIHYSYPVVTRKNLDKPLSSDYIREWREFLQTQPYGNVQDWLQFIGAENKQGNITAHECLEILKNLSLKPFESRYKIQLIWMPEYLGEQGNRLLKLLEEPPPSTVFILVAEQPERILGTLLSRTQLVKLLPLGQEDISGALVSRAGLGESQALQLAGIAAGNYREALQLILHAHEDLLESLRLWLNLLLTASGKGLQEWLEQIGSAKTGRENQKLLLRYFIYLVELALRARFLGPERLNLPPAELDFADRLNRIAGTGQLAALTPMLEDAIYHIERNANGRILFHALSIRLARTINTKQQPA